MFLSPGCIFILLKSTVFLSIRAGVPVLNLCIFMPSPSMLSVSLLEGNIPLGPLFIETSPIIILAFKYTPVANITALAVYLAPTVVTTPLTTLFCTIILSTSPCFKYKLDWFSRTFFICTWYRFLSAWARKEWTAGPLPELSILI